MAQWSVSVEPPVEKCGKIEVRTVIGGTLTGELLNTFDKTGSFYSQIDSTFEFKAIPADEWVFDKWVTIDGLKYENPLTLKKYGGTSVQGHFRQAPKREAFLKFVIKKREEDAAEKLRQYEQEFNAIWKEKEALEAEGNKKLSEAKGII